MEQQNQDQSYWLVPTYIFNERELLKQALRIEQGKAVAMADINEVPSKDKRRTFDGIIGPGLFDIQVNGGGGVMLNNDPSVQGVEAIAKAHRKCGTSFILPTVITDEFEVMERAAHAVLDSVGKNGVLGIHIEGPYISLQYKGTHDPKYIRDYEEKTTQILRLLRSHDVPVLLTLAPECVPAGLIEQLTQMGVRVSGGHSGATSQETIEALDEGLSCFTHLFNAMTPMSGRAPGMTGAAINSMQWCGIISDGYHVSDAMLSLAINARPMENRMIVVSDAMSTVGGPDHFELYGQIIRVEGGRLINKDGALAGAHIDLKTSVKRLVENINIEPAKALAMATLNPRDLMGIAHQSIIGSTLDELSFSSFEISYT